MSPEEIRSRETRMMATFQALGLASRRTAKAEGAYRRAQRREEAARDRYMRAFEAWIRARRTT